ncbi:MAG TPA: transposase, partial [Ramlibacter sp.]|nr:transposase [Ramlibacter sp.]
STRSSPQGGEHGYDAGKKVKGRKRHLVVDTLGLLLAVVVTSASVQDRAAAGQALAQAQERTGHTIQTLYADSAYAGKVAAVMAHEQQVKVQIIRRVPSWRWDDAQQSLWEEMITMPILPKRWVVERSHAWLEKCRRLTMHHDRTPRAATAWAWLAQARMLMTRLAQAV